MSRRAATAPLALDARRSRRCGGLWITTPTVRLRCSSLRRSCPRFSARSTSHRCSTPPTATARARPDAPPGAPGALARDAIAADEFGGLPTAPESELLAASRISYSTRPRHRPQTSTAQRPRSKRARASARVARTRQQRAAERRQLAEPRCARRRRMPRPRSRRLQRSIAQLRSAHAATNTPRGDASKRSRRGLRSSGAPRDNERRLQTLAASKEAANNATILEHQRCVKHYRERGIVVNRAAAARHFSAVPGSSALRRTRLRPWRR